MSSFDLWLIGSLFVVLMVNTIVQYKLGFSSGTKGGYTVGLYHAVCWMMKKKAVDITDSKTGNPASAAEVVAFILASKDLASMSNLNETDLELIAKAMDPEKDRQ